MSTPLRVLVTGFGPFGPHARNPSGALAEGVDGEGVQGEGVQGAVLMGRVLPVEWRRAWPMLRAAVDETRPDALLMTGVAPTPDIRLEVLAKNFCDAREDVVGACPSVGPLGALRPGGAAALQTTLPVEAMLRALDQSAPAGGVPARLSGDAGGYLCNQVFYEAACDLHTVRWRGFVHLPPYDHPGSESPVDAGRRVVAALVASLPAVA